MQTFYGTVIELLRDANDRGRGFVLEGGEAIHFSTDHLDLVAAFVTLSSEGAFEFATTSAYLSRVVEGVVSRTLRSDTSYPSLVPPPPVHPGTCQSPGRVQDELVAVEAVLARVHWLLENGKLILSIT
jgi:hypothetical protein